MSKIILGIDPGYGRMGWGVIDFWGQKSEYVAADCLETAASLRFEQRLQAVFHEVSQLIKVYKPEALAVESLFFNTNAKTAILTSHARGVIVLAGVEAGLPVYDYTPLQVKQALVGYGRGDKKQVQTMLKFHLNLSELPRLDDACDALAVALTHAYTNRKITNYQWTIIKQNISTYIQIKK